MEIIVYWGEKEKEQTRIHDVSELDDLIDRIMKGNKNILPILLVIKTRGYELSFPVGLNESFLQITKESGAPPYRMAIENRDQEGFETFMLEGIHDTEIPKRFVISEIKVRGIVKEFIIKGKPSNQIHWEEI